MSDQRMYAVDVTVTVMVVARSVNEAERVAKKAAREYDAVDGANYCATTALSVPPQWRGCLPYGEPDEERESWTAEQWLAAQTEPAK